MNITNLDWNHFQLILTAQFCVAEEVCDYEYTPTCAKPLIGAI